MGINIKTVHYLTREVNQDKEIVIEMNGEIYPVMSAMISGKQVVLKPGKEKPANG